MAENQIWPFAFLLSHPLLDLDVFCVWQTKVVKMENVVICLQSSSKTSSLPPCFPFIL